ncbi:MAG TPA: CBS domain-containing protein [Streptosporangiaceae bacterium]|jgi:CBS domain-containing protein|nr:CBS domain-containing protein [Streptosporangiaceae bacterium]
MILTAKDVMRQAPGFVSENSSITQAAQLLERHGQGALPICTADGQVVGMITDRDIAIKVVAAGKDPVTTSVCEVSRIPVVALAEQGLQDVLTTMREHHVRRMPVLQSGKLVGLISFIDIAKNLPLSDLGDLSFVGDFFHPTAI